MREVAREAGVSLSTVQWWIRRAGDERLDLQRPPKGLIIFMRRTTARGGVTILERPYVVDPHWVHRLVRCELDLTHGLLRFYALRRRAPHDQPLLSQTPYHQPKKGFYE